MYLDEILTSKRREILNYIDTTQKARGYPPSVREIGEACRLASPSSVQFHLKILQEQGFLLRDPSKPRALTIKIPSQPEIAVDSDSVEVPLLGDVAAGIGTLAQETVSEETITVPRHLGMPGTLFALHVKGDSMLGDGIFDNDTIVARKQAWANTGDIVVAGINDQSEATVKRIEFFNGQNLITLHASNPRYAPMQFVANEVTLYGKVVMLQRMFK